MTKTKKVELVVLVQLTNFYLRQSHQSLAISRPSMKLGHVQDERTDPNEIKLSTAHQKES